MDIKTNNKHVLIDLEKQKQNELVQEVLCLIQGNHGKYLSFSEANCPRLIETKRSKSNAYNDAVDEQLIDRNEMFLIKRLASIGILYRILNYESDKLSCGSPNSNLLVKRQFGSAFKQELIKHFDFVTGLYADCQNLTLFKLDSLLVDTKRKFWFMHQLIRIVEKVTEDEAEILDQLFSLTNYGDRLIEETVINLFHHTVKPLLVTVRKWITQKCIDFSTRKELENFPKFFNFELAKLITKFGHLMAIFKQVSSKESGQTMETTLETVLDELSLADLSMRNKAAKLNDFYDKLQTYYVLINKMVLDELACRGAFQNLLKPIQILSTMDLESFQQNQTKLKDPFADKIWSKETKFLINFESRQTYQRILGHFISLKMNMKDLSESWKEMIDLYFSITDRWDFNVKPMLKQMFWAIFLMTRIVVAKETESVWIVMEEVARFEKEISVLKFEILCLNGKYEKLMRMILSRIEFRMDDGEYELVQNILDNFPDRIRDFITKANELYESEQGKWYEEKLENREKFCNNFENFSELFKELIKQ